MKIYQFMTELQDCWKGQDRQKINLSLTFHAFFSVKDWKFVNVKYMYSLNRQGNITSFFCSST